MACNFTCKTYNCAIPRQKYEAAHLKCFLEEGFQVSYCPCSGKLQVFFYKQHKQEGLHVIKQCVAQLSVVGFLSFFHDWEARSFLLLYLNKTAGLGPSHPIKMLQEVTYAFLGEVVARLLL